MREASEGGGLFASTIASGGHTCAWQTYSRAPTPVQKCMALRQIVSRGHFLQTLTWGPALQRCQMSATPTVYDKMVQVTVIDKAGHRFPVRGLEGQTLVEALGNQDALDVHDYLCLGPQGRDEPECVVSVPNEFLERIPPPGEDDIRSLEQIAESSITPKCDQLLTTASCSSTRLGSKIVFSKDLNEMLVALGEAYPWKTL